jgi:hypothetical protein
MLLLEPPGPDAEAVTVIPAEAGIQEKGLVPDFRRDDVWTPAPSPDPDPGFAGVTTLVGAIPLE